jgi:hypothetical protein
MQIVDCIQGTEAWFLARAGIPTASEFATVLAKGKGKSSAESRTRRTYLLKLAGERITGKPMVSYSGRHTERGHEMEPEARDFYAFLRDVDPVQIGFVRNDIAGASPDSLIGDDGLLEIKTALPHILGELILKDQFPPEHRAQTQGQLWVTGRAWVDIIVYWPGMPPLIKRAKRDEAYIDDLAAAVRAFNDELDEIVAKIRAYGGQEAA